jgi:hypothetical protein
MPISLFVSRLGIIDLKLAKKIKIHANLIKLFHFEIYIILFLFKSSISLCNNIWEYHLNKYTASIRYFRELQKSCPDLVFHLIDNPKFPHQNVKETFFPD